MIQCPWVLGLILIREALKTFSNNLTKLAVQNFIVHGSWVIFVIGREGLTLRLS